MEESDLLGELKKETIWIDHTSTDPDEAVRLSAKAIEKGNVGPKSVGSLNWHS